MGRLPWFQHQINHGDAAGMLQTGGERVGESFFDPFFFDQAIDDDFNRVGVVFVEFDRVTQFPHLAINPHPHKPLGTQPRQQFFVGAFFTTHHWGENLETTAIGQFHDAIAHLVNRLRGNRAIADGTVGFTRPPKQ